MNNLITKIGDEVRKATSHAIKGLIPKEIPLKIKIHLCHNCGEKVLAQMGVAPAKARKIDENYDAPLRYIISGMTNAVMLTGQAGAAIPYSPTFLEHGAIGDYFVYSEIMFPPDIFLVLEDDRDEINVIAAASVEVVV